MAGILVTSMLLDAAFVSLCSDLVLGRLSALSAFPMGFVVTGLSCRYCLRGLLCSNLFLARCTCPIAGHDTKRLVQWWSRHQKADHITRGPAFPEAQSLANLHYPENQSCWLTSCLELHPSCACQTDVHTWALHYRHKHMQLCTVMLMSMTNITSEFNGNPARQGFGA